MQDDGFSCSNDENAEYIGAGKEYLQQENYKEALSGNSIEVLSLIEDYSPDYDVYYYEQAVLLKANLLIENFDADGAISLIRTHKAQAVGVAGKIEKPLQTAA